MSEQLQLCRTSAPQRASLPSVGTVQGTAACVCGESVTRPIGDVDRVLGLGTVQATCPRCGWHLNARAFGLQLFEVRSRADDDETIAGVYATSTAEAIGVIAALRGLDDDEIASLYAVVPERQGDVPLRPESVTKPER